MDRLEFEAKVAMELGMGMTEPWGKPQYEVMRATLKVAAEVIRDIPPSDATPVETHLLNIIAAKLESLLPAARGGENE